MAEKESKGKGIKDGSDVRQVAVVQSTTDQTPAEADKSSLPNALDAKPEDPPVRASRPDTPIAQVLTAGAGEHMPPDPDQFRPDGRVRPRGEDASADKPDQGK